MEYTNVKKGGELKLGIKDKDGKIVSFITGMTISDDMFADGALEKSASEGVISLYLKKGWVVKGKVNTANKIIGSPVPFKGLTDVEAEGLKPKDTIQTLTIDDGVKIVSDTVPQPKTEEKKETVASETPSKKKGRPAKAVEVKAIETIEPVNEVKEDKPVETPVAEVKKEEDFL